MWTKIRYGLGAYLGKPHRYGCLEDHHEVETKYRCLQCGPSIVQYRLREAAEAYIRDVGISECKAGLHINVEPPASW